jgi:hypothetical protein
MMLHWDYDFWLLFALAVWLFSPVVGAGYFGRASLCWT